ncbi:VirB8/TrbF family protein [Candidatus Binatus sp.]|uniref:VirB8/TrbF family protein n=1 Tax=Candidatus Binatus sp. TaxID=2811406 RepID=UPI003F9D5527
MDNQFYLQARREWDERYGDLVLGKRNWQITSTGLMLVSLILALGIVWMGAQLFALNCNPRAVRLPAGLQAAT